MKTTQRTESEKERQSVRPMERGRRGKENVSYVYVG